MALIIENKASAVFHKLYLLFTVVNDQGNIFQTLYLRSFAKVSDNEDLPIDQPIYFLEKNESNESLSQIHVLVTIIKKQTSFTEYIYNTG